MTTMKLTKTVVAKAEKKGVPVSDETIAGVARRAILSGKSNAEVLAAIKAAFPRFPTTRRGYYPRWFRAQLVMKGVISRTFASNHAR